MLTVEIDKECRSYPCDFLCSSKEDAIFELIDGELCPSVPPSWLEQLGTSDDNAPRPLASHIPFLESFLPEATDFWSIDQDGYIVSDFWTQTDVCGDKIHLLAYAVSLKGKKYLLIRSEDALYKERERLQRYAHEAVIQLKLGARRHCESSDMATSLGQLLQRLQRGPRELVARIGEEAFGIVLPGLDSDSAIQVGQIVNRIIRELGMSHSTSFDYVATTVSIGICMRTPNSEATMQQMFQAADDALYQAKLAGRDRVMTASAHAGRIP